MVDLLKNCITELNKPNEERNIEVVESYLKTLTPFIQMLKQDISKFTDILNQICKLVRLHQCPTNTLIIRNGEKGNDFYIILEGRAAVLGLKLANYSMTENEYITHLLKLRKNNEIDLLKQCIQLNNLTYPIGDENFDVFIKNVAYQKSKGTIYQDNPEIIAKTKEALKYLRSHQSDIEKENSAMAVEDYINMNKVDVYTYIKFGDESKKKNVVIPNYEVVNTIEQGQTFGDIALESANNKRTASIITIENCSFGVVNKNDYFSFLKNVNTKNRKKFFSVIFSYNIFQNISRYVFEKKYYNFFKYQKCERNQMLVRENEKNETIFFTLNGEYEISTNRNIVEVNNLIIQYKKTLIKLQQNSKRNLFNTEEKSRKLKSLLNYEEEEKENEDLILNVNFKTQEQNDILLSKRTIKFGIVKNREIIGLHDFITEEGLGLANCRCLSYNGGVYGINHRLYYKIFRNEDKMQELSSEWLIKKLSFLIERLNQHKDSIYSIIKKNENESAEFYYNIELRNQDLNRKNRLYAIENNSTFAKNANDIISSRGIKKTNKTPKKNLNYIYYDPKKRKKLLNAYINPKQLMLFKINKERSSNEEYFRKYRRDLFSRNLYDNLFNSYLRSSSLSKEKETIETNNSGESSPRNKEDVSISYHQCKTETGNMNLVDFMVMDKFNSCYKQIFRNLNVKV